MGLFKDILMQGVNKVNAAADDNMPGKMYSLGAFYLIIIIVIAISAVSIINHLIDLPVEIIKILQEGSVDETISNNNGY